MEHDHHVFCQHIAKLHQNILVTAIVENGHIISSFFRPLVYKPKSDRLKTMLGQAHLLVSIPKTNEDFFGKVCYTMVCHEGLHVFIFPMSDINLPMDPFNSNIDSKDTYENNDGLQARSKTEGFSPLFIMIAMPPYNFDDVIPQVVQKLRLSSGCNMTVA